MKARSLMRRDIEACMPTDSAAKAIEIMRRRNCGFIPVIRSFDDWHLDGVFTDRDLVLFLGKTDRQPSKVQVGEFCCRGVKSVFEDDTSRTVIALMEAAKIHRVPVVDHAGRLTGIISLKELAEEAYREKDIEFPPEIPERDIAEIVESIALVH
jgi:CBS domain-containing protein